jgi:hypothetical protein
VGSPSCTSMALGSIHGVLNHRCWWLVMSCCAGCFLWSQMGHWIFRLIQ